MRNNADVYSSLLKVQTELSFEEEIKILRNSRWDDAKLVLDYGCGNAYFSYCLSQRHSEKEFYCIDSNKEILEKVYNNDKIRILCGEFPSVDIPTGFDFIIIRHLTSYLSDRKSFFSWLSKHANANASLLLIDAFDDLFSFEPQAQMPNFKRGLDSFQESVSKNGGERKLIDLVDEELAAYGFHCKKTNKFCVDSRQLHKKEKMFVYMNLVAESDNGLPLSEKIREELMQWISNDSSYLQYGLFAKLYEMNSM